MLFNKDPMILDYQNPEVFPWRYFYRADMRFDERLWILQNSYGLFYQFSPLAERYSTRADLYAPRHISYRGIDEDPEIQEYLRRDGRMVYLADMAVPEDKASLARILEAGWDRRVVLVRDATDHVSDPTQIRLVPAAQVPVRIQHWDLPLDSMKRQKTAQGIVYSAFLPLDFPSYLTTTVFTTDYFCLQLRLAGQAFNAVQGDLVVPFSFDVGNIHTRRLTVLLPAAFPAAGRSFELTARTLGDITAITRNTNDELAFAYQAPHEGWLVLHYPFDPKWELTVDGRQQNIYRINRHFIGTFIDQGAHRIVLRYWPHTPLRFFTGLSMVLVIVVFVMAVGFGLRQE
jgi:hypothetical protein